MPHFSTSLARKGFRAYRRFGGPKNVWRMLRDLVSKYRYLRGLINVERKFIDVNVSGSVISTPTISHLSAIAQGDGASSRDGNSVKLKSFVLRGNVLIHPSATNSIIRIIVFTWNNQSAPAQGDLLASSSNAISLLNPNRSGMYHVLMDKMIDLNTVSTKSRNVKAYRKLNLHTKFDSTGTTDYTSGTVWSLVMSNETSFAPTVDLKYRLRYVDN